MGARLILIAGAGAGIVLFVARWPFDVVIGVMIASIVLALATVAGKAASDFLGPVAVALGLLALAAFRVLRRLWRKRHRAVTAA